MSNGTNFESEQTQLHEQESVEVGGRIRRKHPRHNKTKSNKKDIIVGKVYADWCGHCQMLKPEWAKMKKHIYSKKGKKHVVFAEVEEKQIGTKLRKLEKDHGVKVEANGYPTLFRIEGGKVKYYNGDRQSHAMSQWYLKGGDAEEGPELQEPLIPGLMQDQQGGRHRFHTRRRGRHWNRFHNQHKGTRRHFEKKTPGVLDFLFGK